MSAVPHASSDNIPTLLAVMVDGAPPRKFHAGNVGVAFVDVPVILTRYVLLVARFDVAKVTFPVSDRALTVVVASKFSVTVPACVSVPW